MISGILIVDKPQGLTSHDVIDRVRRVYGTRKVGHAGTLDPGATGVLVIGLGRATRLLRFLQGLPKTYRGVIRFGITTTTQDAAGEVVDVRSCFFGREELEEAARAFVGEIEQVPPMVSAVKVGGEPLYRAARRGEEVERKPRAVKIEELAVEDFDSNSFRATVFVRCSSGTYIRTLAVQLGERLGCGAHLEALRRLAVGSFAESEAVELRELERLDHNSRLGRVLPMHAAMRDFAVRIVDGAELAAVRNGRMLPVRDLKGPPDVPRSSAAGSLEGTAPLTEDAESTAATPVAIVDPAGHLVAVYVPSQGALRPGAVLAPSPPG